MNQRIDPKFEDEFIECRDCGHLFRITADEQKWLWEHGLSNYKRCVPCRQRRKAEREAATGKDGAKNG
jgi:hypothetical protein